MNPGVHTLCDMPLGVQHPTCLLFLGPTHCHTHTPTQGPLHTHGGGHPLPTRHTVTRSHIYRRHLNIPTSSPQKYQSSQPCVHTCHAHTIRGLTPCPQVTAPRCPSTDASSVHTSYICRNALLSPLSLTCVGMGESNLPAPTAHSYTDRGPQPRQRVRLMHIHQDVTVALRTSRGQQNPHLGAPESGTTDRGCHVP